MTEIKTDFEIRQAEEEDVPEILELIKALAEFENLSEEVVATEELLKITLFGINSPAEVQIAFDKNKTLGFALYFRHVFYFFGTSRNLSGGSVCAGKRQRKRRWRSIAPSISATDTGNWRRTFRMGSVELE